MTPTIKLDRPINAQEIGVIRAALERGPRRSIAPHVMTSIENLRVVGQWSCGCEGLDFADRRLGECSWPIAEGLGTTAAGEHVGIIVWGRDDAITGLELYAMAEPGGKLPVPNSIRGLEPQKT